MMNNMYVNHQDQREMMSSTDSTVSSNSTKSNYNPGRVRSVGQFGNPNSNPTTMPSLWMPYQFYWQQQQLVQQQHQLRLKQQQQFHAMLVQHQSQFGDNTPSYSQAQVETINRLRKEESEMTRMRRLEWEREFNRHVSQKQQDTYHPLGVGGGGHPIIGANAATAGGFPSSLSPTATSFKPPSNDQAAACQLENGGASIALYEDTDCPQPLLQVPPLQRVSGTLASASDPHRKVLGELRTNGPLPAPMPEGLPASPDRHDLDSREYSEEQEENSKKKDENGVPQFVGVVLKEERGCRLSQGSHGSTSSGSSNYLTGTTASSASSTTGRHKATAIAPVGPLPPFTGHFPPPNQHRITSILKKTKTVGRDDELLPATTVPTSKSEADSCTASFVATEDDSGRPSTETHRTSVSTFTSAEEEEPAAEVEDEDEPTSEVPFEEEAPGPIIMPPPPLTGPQAVDMAPVMQQDYQVVEEQARQFNSSLSVYRELQSPGGSSNFFATHQRARFFYTSTLSWAFQVHRGLQSDCQHPLHYVVRNCPVSSEDSLFKNFLRQCLPSLTRPEEGVSVEDFATQPLPAESTTTAVAAATVTVASPDSVLEYLRHQVNMIAHGNGGLEVQPAELPMVGGGAGAGAWVHPATKAKLRELKDFASMPLKLEIGDTFSMYRSDCRLNPLSKTHTVRVDVGEVKLLWQRTMALVAITNRAHIRATGRCHHSRYNTHQQPAAGCFATRCSNSLFIIGITSSCPEASEQLSDLLFRWSNTIEPARPIATGTAQQKFLMAQCQRARLEVQWELSAERITVDKPLPKFKIKFFYDASLPMGLDFPYSHSGHLGVNIMKVRPYGGYVTGSSVVQFNPAHYRGTGEVTNTNNQGERCLIAFVEDLRLHGGAGEEHQLIFETVVAPGYQAFVEPLVVFLKPFLVVD